MSISIDRHSKLTAQYAAARGLLTSICRTHQRGSRYQGQARPRNQDLMLAAGAAGGGTVSRVLRPKNSSHNPECSWGVAAPTWNPRPGPLPGARGAHSQPNLWPCSRAWAPLFSWFLPAGGRARRRQKIFGGFSPPQASSAVDRDILGSRAYVVLIPF